VALDCAIRCPERVSRLILAATSAISCKRNNALLYDWFRYVESGMKPEYWFRNLFYWILSEDFFADEKRVEDAVQNAIADPYA
jgi:pimeloyl-ACP methyl ester carboxylesterase